MTTGLNARTGLISVVLYMIGSVIAGLAAAIYFRGLSTSSDARIIDNVIDSSMFANIIVSGALALVCFVIFRGSIRDIFFEKASFTLSKLYYTYPLILLGIIIWALANVEWASYSLNVILLVVVASIAIGFNEEVVTRGILVVGLRNSDVREWQVFAISTVIFGLLHAINLLGFSNFTQILVTLVSGSLFYIARRVSNTLLLPIALHALYDIGFFLLTGIYAEESGSLPDHVLDIQFLSFLIMLLSTIVFIILGRGLLRTAKPVTA